MIILTRFLGDTSMPARMIMPLLSIGAIELVIESYFIVFVVFTLFGLEI